MPNSFPRRLRGERKEGKKEELYIYNVLGKRSGEGEKQRSKEEK